MRLVRIILLSFVVFGSTVILSGCWNYREIEELALVAGVAVDKGSNDNYKLTVEIVEVSGGNDTKINARLISTEGKTIFDSARNEISIRGKKLYWSHAKVLIISEEIAKDGILQILDWFTRDAETREDINVLISKGPAKDILSAEKVTDKVMSFELEEMINNQSSLSKARKVELWELNNELAAEGLSATAPKVFLETVEGKLTSRILGTALFSGDKLLGFIDGEKTKTYLFIRNQIDGGLLVDEKDMGLKGIPITLEIFKSTTKSKPRVFGNNAEVELNNKTVVSIAEIGGTENVIDNPLREKLEEMAEEELSRSILELTEMVQKEFGVDAFGFGHQIKRENPKVWKKIKNDWDSIFANLKVNANIQIEIRNSGMLTEPLEIGE